MLKIEQKQSSIKVFVRIRPLLQHEEGQETIVQADQEGKKVEIIQSMSTYKQEFDVVFGQGCTQLDIFTALIPGIEQLHQGFNSTIVAYGQTGSGKTYTMFGSDWEYQSSIMNSEVRVQHQATFCEDLATDVNNAGIIPRSIYQLFNQIEQENSYLYCSFLQVYNEKIFDLLQDSSVPKALSIHESKMDGIYVEGLTEYAVNHYYDCLTLMKRGEKNRYIRQTSMNMKSSRSHTIFQILIESNKADKNGQLKKCKLNLCDLAGSEKINKNENMKQQHLLELKSINQSLTTLGKVIHNLSQNGTKKNTLPIPYRESKLTRLLQDSLGGNTQTYIVANITSSIYNMDETSSTLKFAERAKNISVTVQANKINATDSELVKKLLGEIDYLKGMLNMKRKGLNTQDVHFKLMKIQEENIKLKKDFVSVNEVESLIQENRTMKVELQKMQQAMTLGSVADYVSEFDSSPQRRLGMSDSYQKPLSGTQPLSVPLQQRLSQQTFADSNSFINNSGTFEPKEGQEGTTEQTGQRNRSQMTKTQQDDDFNSYQNQKSTKDSAKDLTHKSSYFQNQGVMVIQNPFSMPKTEVMIRVRGKGSSLQTKKGYVEQSQQQSKKEEKLRNERQRVVERLLILDRIQQQSVVHEDIDSLNEFLVPPKIMFSSKPSLTKGNSNSSPTKMQDQRLKQQKRMQEYDQKLKIIEQQLINN